MKTLEVKMAGQIPEIYMYADIGADFDGVTAGEFEKAVNSIRGKPEIVVRLHSQGGDPFEAMGMYSVLKNHPAKVTMQVDGLAASSASYLMMAGDRIKIAENALVMIHEPESRASGRAAALERRAQMLRSLIGTVSDTYAKRSGKSDDEITRIMEAETWMGAKEAVAQGFADEVTPVSRIQMRVDASRFIHPPQRLLVTDGKAAAAYRKRIDQFKATKG